VLFCVAAVHSFPLLYSIPLCDVPEFIYPFSFWRTFGIPVFCLYKQCCCKHYNLCLLVHIWKSFSRSEWNWWVIGYTNDKRMPNCLPKYLDQFIPHQQCIRVSDDQYPFQHLAFSHFCLFYFLFLIFSLPSHSLVLTFKNFFAN